MAATTLHGPDEVRAALGRHLGHSDWLTITQEHIDRFADATSTDAENTADGSTAVPVLFTLSLSNLFLPQLVEVRGFAMGVNYGTGSIRFPEPVRAGSRMRARAELVAVEPVPGGLQTTIRITIEVEGRAEPAAVIDSLSRWLVNGQA
ncbi:MAG: MaoC family dehydratase [Acidimicrobiia bacterium]